MKTCVIYCRVSSERQVDNTSLESQRRTCEEHAERHGLRVLKVFIDRGESAKTSDRPEFNSAVAYCSDRKRKVDHFIVYKLDRFARHQDDHVMVRSVLRKGGTELLSATEPIDETPVGRAMEGMISVFAEFDNNIRTERTKAGMKARAEDGYWVWSAPLGYHKPKKGKKINIQPDPEKSRLIRRAFEEYSKGTYTYKALADHLNERGLRSRYGKRMSQQTIEKMLHNPVYRGVICAFGGEYKAGFDSLVSDKVWWACQKGNRPSFQDGPRTANNPMFPLKKLIACQECGVRLRGSSSKGRKGKRYAYYHHGSHKCNVARSIPKEELEQKFVEYLDSITPDIKYMNLFKAVVRDVWQSKYKQLDSDNAIIRKQIEKLENERQTIFNNHRKGIYTDDEFTEQKKRIIGVINAKNYLLEEQRIEEFDMEKAMDFCFNFVKKTSQRWLELESNYQARIRFQQLIFKSGLEFDGEKFGTAELSPIYQLKTTSRGEKSLLVAPRGIEPRLPH